ncbi:hypothetical protein MASR2M15_18570 [Anaerolineales bacterium]
MKDKFDLQGIQRFLLQNANTTRLSPHTSIDYTGSPRLNHGISVPNLRTFLKAWLKTQEPLTNEDWLSILDQLYTGNSIEERVLAGMIFGQYKAFRAELAFKQLDTWLGQLEGWVEVDSTCQSSYTTKEMQKRWAEWQPFLRQLAEDENINKRRASLVLLIKPLRDEKAENTLLPFAFEQVRRLMSENDRLITKAISWLLREACKHHGKQVRLFLKAEVANLPAFVVREVQTKLDTGKKTT